jgi:hypothetical protein
MGHLMRKLLKKYDSIVVHLGVYIVDLCAFYSHRIIGKLTAFLSHTHNNVKETIFRKIWDLWINGRGLDGKTRSIMIRAGPFTPRECQHIWGDWRQTLEARINGDHPSASTAFTSHLASSISITVARSPPPAACNNLVFCVAMSICLKEEKKNQRIDLQPANLLPILQHRWVTEYSC